MWTGRTILKQWVKLQGRNFYQSSAYIWLVLQHWGNQFPVFILSPLNGANFGRGSLSSPPRETVPLSLSSGVTRRVPGATPSTLKAVSVPNAWALQARCKFGNHAAKINHRWLDDVIAQGLPFHCVDVAPLCKSTNFTFEYGWQCLVARWLATSSLQPASTIMLMYSCVILALLPVGEFVSSRCSHPCWVAVP